MTTALLTAGAVAPRRGRRVIHVVARPPREPRRPVGGDSALLQPHVVLLALTALSGALSALLLLRQSLRLDEAQSLWQTSHGFGRMYELVAQDVHVPLYHTVLRVWVLLVGNGVTATSLLSLLLFLLLAMERVEQPLTRAAEQDLVDVDTTRPDQASAFARSG